MEPIISPWVFYLMAVVDNFTFVVGVLAVITIIVVGVHKIDSIFEDYSYKPKRMTLIFLGVALSCLILVPTQSTLTKMLVAQNVTYERVEMVGDTVQDVYEDIISLVDGNESEGEE